MLPNTDTDPITALSAMRYRNKNFEIDKQQYDSMKKDLKKDLMD